MIKFKSILEYPSDHKRITESKITDTELQSCGKKVSDNMYFPF
jgi:maltose phosphorylase